MRAIRLAIFVASIPRSKRGKPSADIRQRESPSLVKNPRQRQTRRPDKQPSAPHSTLKPATVGAAVGQRKIWLRGAGAAVAAIIAAAGFWHFAAGHKALDSGGANASATFVGSETCAGCHQTEAKLWLSSHHRLAMRQTTDQTVLGNFDNSGFDYHGVHSRFFRRDGKFLVETDGPDGKLATYEIKYTFGVDPLQQYLIEFPDGRLQALSIAWDARPKDRGGQRWFHLYPGENVDHNDPLHWTRLNQNWNFMCAACHSTGLHKNYEPEKDRFATTWSEISVGCEACHGQGSAHVAFAHDRQAWWPFRRSEDPAAGLLVRFDERQSVAWRHDPVTGSPQRSLPPTTLRKEVETCGLCHARRGALSEDWVPGRWLSDTQVVTPLSRGLYSEDGQMRDGEEVYNYGPFKQSRMFAAGVTCSDCHDPHSAELRFDGDAVCLQCHSAGTYAAATHGRHDGVSPPVGCVSCHMPTRTYMVVDRRHDHSFRIPRPDLSAVLGTPNACNDCHTDRSPQWATAAVQGWFGPDRLGFQTYAQAFRAAWTDEADAETLLAGTVGDANTPAFVRASALRELAAYMSTTTVELARKGLADPDPMVRIGALDMLEGAPPSQLWPLAARLLTDPIRGVRIRAADLLAGVPAAGQPAAEREHFEAAAAEFVAAQEVNADRPEARSALGSSYARRGLFGDAEAEYRAALRLDPQFAPAAINLADLYRQTDRNSDGIQLLRTAIAASPRDAGLHHALGLALVRAKRPDEALGELRQAATLDPESADYVYVYAVALNSAGHLEEAISVLDRNIARHPNDRDTLTALVALSRDAGDPAAALAYAERLAHLLPDSSDLDNLIRQLRQQAGKPARQ